MHIDQEAYRGLHDAILEANLKADARVLTAFVERNPQEVDWLSSFRSSDGPAVPATIEARWRLYALSRVLDYIIWSFQPGDEPPAAADGLSLDDCTAFATALGLTVLEPRHFSAFDCEIVRAENSLDTDAPIALTGIHWPCLMLGDLLLLRAGVSIRGGSRFFDASVARSSTMYWTYRRKNRPSDDLSAGWGGNSQWRTAFRRDYRVDDALYFNADGQTDLAAPVLAEDADNPLTREERIELLTNRCFLVTTKEHRDLCPYDDTLRINSVPNE